MKTYRIKLVALLWWVLPGSSLAIGIGDMTVTSYINQPLQANIEVLQPDGLLESEVIASLASPDDFDRLGLERHYSLNSLRFAADFSRASRPVITVTTDDPVLEPYLSFLVELKWPEGRVLREYTVFWTCRRGAVVSHRRTLTVATHNHLVKLRLISIVWRRMTPWAA